MHPRAWYRIDAKAEEPTVADVHIIDFIGDWIDDYWGFGVTAKAFIEQLSKIPDAVTKVRVHINSPGGDVFAALNIANALREMQASKGRTVETIVDGLSASAATIIQMAGSIVTVADNALVMIHNPWTVGVGTAADMRKTADTLDTVRNTIIATYKWHSTLSDEVIGALMDAETWMDADEAIAQGFATNKVDGLSAAAALDVRAVAKLTVPEKFRNRLAAFTKPAPAAPAPMAATEVLRACREAGVLDLAEELVRAAATSEQVTARLTAAKSARAQAKTRTDEITAVCTVAKLPELAAGYIAGAMAVADVRAHVTIITAKKDVEIDATLGPDQRPSQQKAPLNAATIYAERNRPSAH